MNKLRRKLNGSITVEAAFSFTLTIFILFLMLGPLFIIKTSSDILLKLNDAPKIRCNYEMAKDSFRGTEIYNTVEKYISDNDFLNNNIKNIENIIDFGKTIIDFDSIYDETKSEYRNISYLYNKNPEVYNDDTDEVKYDFIFSFSLPYNLLHIEDVNKRLVNNRRAFVGSIGDRFSLKEDSGDYVYIANNFRTSNVYHLFIDCNYLIKVTEEVPYKDISSKRNTNRHKYTKCDYCFKRIKIKENTTCYITETGEKYHSRSDCPVMTAYVTKIPRDIIDSYDATLCHRCSSRENK